MRVLDVIIINIIVIDWSLNNSDSIRINVSLEWFLNSNNAPKKMYNERVWIEYLHRVEDDIYSDLLW